MTIAATDPSGGAGLQADLKTFAALQVYGLSAITAVIAQNSAHVERVEAVDPGLVFAQIETVVAERLPDALKTGALVSAAVIRTVIRALDKLSLPAPVVDPVLVSSSGTRLLEPAGERLLRTEIIPRARLITPNIPEAEVLTGIEIDSAAAMRRAAEMLRSCSAAAVLIKGGHWQEISDGRQSRVVDLLFDGQRFVEFTALRVPGDGAHGTGCALSAAIAAWLARGVEMEPAIRRAKLFLTRALQNAFAFGNGRRVLDHFVN